MAEDVETGSEQRNRAELADLLRHEIDSGKYPVGTKLPSYRQLAEMYGAAPNTIGEAVRILATEGRVKVKPNAGAVVSNHNAKATSPEQHLRDTRAGLVELRTQLRAVRREVDAIDERLEDLLTDLPAD